MIKLFVLSLILGEIFVCNENIQTPVTDQLKAIPVYEFQYCYEEWMNRLQYCMASQGSYFEGGNTLKRVSLNVGGRIVGGSPANITDYPYQVSVLYSGSHACGGTIISENYILTAAHCTYDVTASELSIRAGSSYHNSGGQVLAVSNIYQHSQFNIDTYDYDISVLKLSASLVFGTGVAKITMVTASATITDGASVVATGWGRLTNDGVIPVQLQVVTLPTITTTSCQQYYGSGTGGVTDRMFCAGYAEGGKDTCQGDSGGPLVLSNTLIGITSWGDICGQAKSPGVYTKLSMFRSYVDAIISS